MINESDDIDRKKGRTFSSIVIEPFKQMKFGIYVIAVSVVFVTLAAGLFVLAFSEQYQHVMGIFSVVDPTMRWELITNDVFYQNAWRLGLLMVGYIGTLFTIVFRLTHRYYGPLVSIERFVGEVSRGEYDKRVTIRNRDELQRLAAKLNAMAETLEKKHGSLVDEEGNRVDRRSGRSENSEDSTHSHDAAS